MIVGAIQAGVLAALPWADLSDERTLEAWRFAVDSLNQDDYQNGLRPPALKLRRKVLQVICRNQNSDGLHNRRVDETEELAWLAIARFLMPFYVDEDDFPEEPLERLLVAGEKLEDFENG